MVLAHGFPELAYSWRHQIPVLAEAGYHVLAPDQRGYGGSVEPDAVEDYDIVALTGDLVGLLDDVGAEQAVFVGHDWGGVVVWRPPLLHPDRVRRRRGPERAAGPAAAGRRPTRAFAAEVFGDNFFYILLLPGARTGRRRTGPRSGHHDAPADGPLTTTDEAAALRMLQPGPEGFIDRIPEPAGCPTGSARTSSTTTSPSSAGPDSPAPLNWYRNFDRNWELDRDNAGRDDRCAVRCSSAAAADPTLAYTPRRPRSRGGLRPTTAK